MDHQINTSLISGTQPLFSVDFNQSGLKTFLDSLATNQNNHQQIIQDLQKENQLKINQDVIKSLFDRFTQFATINEPGLLHKIQINNNQQIKTQQTSSFEIICSNFGNQIKNMAHSISYLYQRDVQKQKQIDEILRNQENFMSKAELQIYQTEMQNQLENKIQENVVYTKRQLEKQQKQLQFQIDEFQNQVQSLEKETIWKIRDCQDLLNKRVNQEYVQTNLSLLEDKLVKQVEILFQINNMSGSKFNGMISSLQIDFENQLNQQEQNLNQKLKYQKSRIDEINGQMSQFIDQQKLIQFQEFNTQKLQDLQKKMVYFENAYDPSQYLNKINSQISVLDYKVNEFEAQIQQKLNEFQANLTQLADPKYRGMVFLPQDNIDPHQICEIENKVQKAQLDFDTYKQNLSNFESEFKSKLNYIESEIISSDNSSIKKMIPKKEEVITWIQDQMRKGNNGGGNTGTIDESYMKDIICDIIDLKKKVADTKELEQRYQRVFQEMNINYLRKSVDLKVDKKDYENTILALQSEIESTQQNLVNMAHDLKEIQKNAAVKTNLTLQPQKSTMNQSNKKLDSFLEPLNSTIIHTNPNKNRFRPESAKVFK